MSIIGIDISKNTLAIHADGLGYSINNDEKALKKWVNEHKLLLKNPSLFVYEPTGGYERKLATFLKRANLDSYRAHANHVRYFAKAMGISAKTDKIDAKVIAMFAAHKEAKPDKQFDRDEMLVSLLDRREQLIQNKKQEASRLETLTNRVIIVDIKSHIRLLDGRIKKLEKAMEQHINENEVLKEQVKLVTSIPGVGIITAVSILAYLPEILTLDNKSIVSLSGLAPMARDSGTAKGKRSIYGGRSAVRRILYMSAVSAMRHNSVIKAFYDRLRLNGKIFKVAITAAMRKLLTIIRSVLTRGTPWNNDGAPLLISGAVN